MPGGGRGKYFSEALRQDGERPGRNVPVLRGVDHFLDRLTFLGGELLRSRLRARGDVVEFALLVAFPRVVSRCGETEDTESETQLEYDP